MLIAYPSNEIHFTILLKGINSKPSFKLQIDHFTYSYMSSRKQSSPEIWKALSNQIRRDLLCFIGEKRIVTFTEIQERFQMKVGTLYHHLDTLGSLIAQDSTKRYFLTEKGKRSYALIEDELDVSAPSQFAYGKFGFLHYVFLRPVFRFIKSDPIRSLGFTLILFIGLLVATYFISAVPIFLFPSFIEPNFIAPFVLMISTGVTYLICEALISLIFRKTTDKIALLQGVIIIQLPLVLLAVVQSLVFDLTFPTSLFDLDVWFIVLIFIIQLIFIALLLESIVVIKEIRFEKAGVIALFIVFITNALSFIIMNLLEVSI